MCELTQPFLVSGFWQNKSMCVDSFYHFPAIASIVLPCYPLCLPKYLLLATCLFWMHTRYVSNYLFRQKLKSLPTTFSLILLPHLLSSVYTCMEDLALTYWHQSWIKLSPFSSLAATSSTVLPLSTCLFPQVSHGSTMSAFLVIERKKKKKVSLNFHCPPLQPLDLPSIYFYPRLSWKDFATFPVLDLLSSTCLFVQASLGSLGHVFSFL